MMDERNQKAVAAAEKATLDIARHIESENARHISVERRLNDLFSDAGIMRQNLDSIRTEMRDMRTQSVNTQRWVEDNAKVTREVRDILNSFHIIGSVAKWLTTVAAALAIVWAITKGWFVGK